MKIAAQGAEPPRKTAWRELSPAGARRLALAYELLEAGEVFRARTVAAPLINEGVSASLIAFILRLRARSTSGGRHTLLAAAGTGGRRPAH